MPPRPHHTTPTPHHAATPRHAVTMLTFASPNPERKSSKFGALSAGTDIDTGTGTALSLAVSGGSGGWVGRVVAVVAVVVVSGGDAIGEMTNSK